MVPHFFILEQRLTEMHRIISITLMSGQSKIPMLLYKVGINISFLLTSEWECTHRLIRPSIFPPILITAAMYFQDFKNILPDLLEDIPLARVQLTWFMHNGILPISLSMLEEN